jgi:hypothetical protein
MADRVSASITIGGALPTALLPDFIALIEQQCLSTEWDGEPFTPESLPDNSPLNLMAHEVAWGRFEELEAFCVKNALPSRAGRAPIPVSGAPNGSSILAAANPDPMPPTRMTTS